MEPTHLFPRSSGEAVTPVQRFFRHFDWVLFGSTAALCAIGLAIVYSACLRFGNPEVYVGRQLTAFAFGMGFLILLSTVNYQVFAHYPRWIFAFSVSLLTLVLAFGTSSHGTRAWFHLGPVYFQPSELSKLFTILVLGVWCDKHFRDIQHIRNLWTPFAVVLCHIALILLQPDFGSTLVYFPILVGMLYVAGAHPAHLLMILSYGGVAALVLLLHTFFSLNPALMDVALWKFLYAATRIGREFVVLLLGLGGAAVLAAWLARQLFFRIPKLYFAIGFLIVAAGWTSSAVFLNSLKEYQRKRLTVFFSPGIDPMGAGYHVIQSKIAIGSGKVFGKGLFSGTQGRLGFLPEQHTDFIFSVLGEELGFAASAFVMGLYLLILWRCVVIAGDARDLFGSMVAVGIACMFGFYILINLAMVMGMAPVTGLPLPFLSYGGSALVSSLAAVGILLSIHVRRYAH